MDCVDRWFAPFLLRHLARFPGPFWPDPETEAGRVFYDGWRQMLADRGVRGDVAEAVSLDLMADPPAFVTDHLAAIIRLSLARQARQSAPAPAVAHEDHSPERQATLEALKASLAAARRLGGDKVPFGERRRAALRSLEARTSPPSPEPGDPTTGTPGPLRGEASQSEPRALDIPEDEAASGWY